MKILVLTTLVALAYAKHEEYIGWKSYYVELGTKDHSKAFGSMVDRYELDVLSHPIIGREGVLLVKPEHQAGFEQDAQAEGIHYRIHVDNIKRALDYDDELLEKHNKESMSRNSDRQLPYDSYQEIEVINDYLDYIGEQYPDVATVVTSGPSYQGRPIKYVKISTTNFTDVSKPVIFFDGGIHAREWISPPTITWAIHKLVENVTENDLLERFDWILLPVINPDGYKFSFTRERFWRKTRSRNENILSLLCPGVDGNRNFGFKWNTVGVHPSPCAENYPGAEVYSEPETRVVRDILHEHLQRIALYITVHSFGSMFLYPWGHDGSLSHNAFGLHTVGVAMANAIDQNSLPHFPRYTVGNAALVLNYETSGSAEDYAHYIGVPLSYTLELPGLHPLQIEGFHLDPKYIKQVCHETWEAFVVGARRAGDLFVNKRI